MHCFATEAEIVSETIKSYSIATQARDQEIPIASDHCENLKCYKPRNKLNLQHYLLK
jgi:hypothetical protein